MKVKLEEYASIAEIISALAIVASLIFVGFQIQNGNRETRAATIQAISEQLMGFTLAMATDEHIPQLASKMMNEGATQSDFSAEDYWRISIVVVTGLRRQENIYLQVQAGVLEPEVLSSATFEFYKNPLVRELWQRRRKNYNQEFALYWDGVLAEK